MAGSKFFTASSIGLWTVVRVQSDLSRGRDNPKPDDALIAQAINAFKEHLAGAGINSTYIPQRPTDIITISGRDSANEAMIRDAFMNLSRRPAAQRPNFVLVTLPSATAPLYNAVKKAGDIHSGIHTVCVQDHMFAKQNGQYFGNVALKFNLKAGGINQIIPPHNLGIIGEEKTMVVGLDVTHPAPNSKEGAPSIAGMVASIDRNLAQWPSTLRVQAGRTEMVEQVGEMLGRHLRLWQKHQKALPSHILIFRDGVSEGQYQLVLDQELAAMKNVCRQIYPPEATSKFFPKFTIIIWLVFRTLLIPFKC
jgi:eukaryotic translation initiation factor 2C